MNSLQSFSDTYSQAREKFVAAAARAGGVVETISHPERGPDGAALSTDVAWFGPRDAECVLVTISATHGVEGFAGSGAQVDWLERGEVARLPSGVAALLIHAINPYGFAWLRRVTQENVDLNRNWIDFDQALPENAGYNELAEAICPTDWSEAGRRQAGKALFDYAARHGKAAFQRALSGGQYQHPTGIFFGGRSPTWSRQTQARILAEYLGRAGKVAIIDFHTGLGPWGLGERIVTDSRASDAFARAARWYGAGVVTPHDGTSSSAPIVGDGLTASVGLLSHAQVTGMALEFGTLPIESVLEALRADAWLHAHGDFETPEGQAIKEQIRAAFYGDAPDWKGMIAGQALLACRQAVSGLSEGQ
jgi:Protein of unknown function (DUF2817)